MILTRTPLRLCLGGGATDLPSYADVYGGMCVTMAIQQYVWVATQDSFNQQWVCRYSETERVSTPTAIRHPILRAVLSKHARTPQEVISLAEVPAGTGLGSSAAFTVGLLTALGRTDRVQDIAHRTDVAEEAFDLEANVLGRPVGRMDQYAVAHGGLLALRFSSRTTAVERLDTPAQWFHDHLRCFYVSAARDAGTMLRDQHVRSLRGDAEMLTHLHEVKALGDASLEAIMERNVRDLAACWRRHWGLKRTRSPGITTQPIDDLIALGLREGALAGKLQGAGGGGCILFLTEQPERLSATMTHQGLREIPIKGDFAGTQVVHGEGPHGV